MTPAGTAPTQGRRRQKQLFRASRRVSTTADERQAACPDSTH
ncbi:hypothetical protein BLA17378_01708 [Burkholderia aenigmatica]|uniref:Uncharacterized protein n=1 Tax=Burkholderia aenigmatica TaxID=2015348 RepID=A0ABY6XSL9_9BURK|nr:hypothetical protein BLA17378_01708 [Burkholderia aenigmatica]VWC81195.1 hypothetical protein BLA18628_01214 [Burkholderia aenigmatica]